MEEPEATAVVAGSILPGPRIRLRCQCAVSAMLRLARPEAHRCTELEQLLSGQPRADSVPVPTPANVDIQHFLVLCVCCALVTPVLGA